MTFPVVMCGYESCTIEKAACQRIDAFELWCWRRLLRASWTARRSNWSILNDINPEYPLEGLMLKLKLQYFSHLMWRTDSLEKTLMLGKIEDRRRKGWQRMRWHHQLNGHELEQAPGVGDGQGGLACCVPWGHKESDMTEWLNNNKSIHNSSKNRAPWQNRLRGDLESRSLSLALPFCHGLQETVWAAGSPQPGLKVHH